MSVFKTKKTPYYQFDFQRDGRRYHGSTKCLKLADAEAFENAEIERVERQNNALKLASILPRNVVREPFGEGWRYYFVVPAKARQAGCPVQSEGLGTNFEKAVARAEDVLLPALASWNAERRKLDCVAVDGLEAPPPVVGVYLLLLKGKVVYVGSSNNMPKRIVGHRSGSRPFDQVFYIATDKAERLKLETILIRAINPLQNSLGIPAPEVPDSVTDKVATNF
jgi:hypothetical protein